MPLRERNEVCVSPGFGLPDNPSMTALQVLKILGAFLLLPQASVQQPNRWRDVIVLERNVL